MRLGLVALSLTVSSQVLADPTATQGGIFVGVDQLRRDIHFDAPSGADRQSLSTELGARAGYGLRLAPRLTFGVEAELAMTLAWTSSPTHVNHTSFSPFFAPRAHVILQLDPRPVGVHVLAGGGAFLVTTSSPYVRNDATPYLGGGLDVRIGAQTALRFDARAVWMPTFGHAGLTATFEGQLGLAHTFGGDDHPAQPAPVSATANANVPPPQPIPVVPPADPNKDSDGDGFPDRLDKCPFEPETVNGIQDDDGCPEGDRDRDGVVDPKDKCPDEPEDRDHFQDEDGCPDPDNDNDGIADNIDVCPNDPETLNGFQDDDGCPDELPDAFKKALASASGVKFEPNKPKITKASMPALAAVVALMQHEARLRIVITAHPEKAGADAEELANKRAEAVRFFLEDREISLVRSDVAVGAVAKPGQPLVEVTVAVKARKGLKPPPD